MCKNPTILNEHFWLMQMLENFRAKRNLYFIFFLPLCPKIVPAPLREVDIYRFYEQIQQFSKRLEYRNIMCFIMNVIIAR